MRYAFALTAALAAAPALAASPQLYPSSAGELAVETLAGGLVNPWSLAFLPDGRMLVTERQGRMRIIAQGGKLSAPIAGMRTQFSRMPRSASPNGELINLRAPRKTRYNTASE